MNPFDDMGFQSESYYLPISDQAFHHQAADDFEKPPLKQLKPKASSCYSPSHIISFHNSNSSPPVISHQYYGLDCALQPGITRTPLHAQEHVIAERKRRERITQSFLSLSALIPGLIKRDKISVLGDAIEYLKQLQERVATLEEQVAKRTVESVKFVKKTQFDADVIETPSFVDSQYPEIEVRVSDKDVLIRIHCETNKGCISSIINEVEKLHLSVINSNAFPLGQAALDITIVARMESEFSMTLKDLVKTLRQGLLKVM
ncbi:transcription factor bHLH25-like [Hibiscus syriacus]|nr:transcription factor bHLH25-like [Hibiscus syriacus]